MTTYYVGIGGDDGNDGLTWANRKLTLNGTEDIPVAAGDTVYVGAGTYRELLTCDVSGSAGNPITYIGDYTGANTDGVGGVVRITGSDDDQTSTRLHCIEATAKDYRTFTGFVFNHTNSYFFDIETSSDHWIIDKCYFGNNNASSSALRFRASPTNHLINNCLFNLSQGGSGASGIYMDNPSTSIDSSGNVIQNCIFVNSYRGMEIKFIGSLIVKNCTFISLYQGIRTQDVSTSYPLNVTNSIFVGCIDYGVSAAVAGQIVEDYNNYSGNKADRGNVLVGANSNTYVYCEDTRWFFEMVNGGDMLTPFDLASYSELIDVAGTSPTSTDMRGTSAIGGTREWGALEYDPDLKIEAGSGGGGVRNVPIPVFIRRRR